MFSSLPSDLSMTFPPVRAQLCAINYTRLAMDLADESGYNNLSDIVSTIVFLKEATIKMLYCFN